MPDTQKATFYLSPAARQALEAERARRLAEGAKRGEVSASGLVEEAIRRAYGEVGA